jgi:hypothetical protein
MDHPECTEEDIISTYYSTRTHSAACPLQVGNINTLITTAVSLLGLDNKGFPREAVI